MRIDLPVIYILICVSLLRPRSWGDSGSTEESAVVSATPVDCDQLFAVQLAVLLGFQFQPYFCPAEAQKRVQVDKLCLIACHPSWFVPYGAEVSSTAV